MNIKKKFAAIIAAGILALSVCPFASAVTPEPANNMQQAQGAVATAAPAAAALQTQNTQTEFVNKKYLTKGSAAFWFVFITAVNIIVSFGIGNRFYRLSRKDNHISGEIRALRKDIEDKMVRSVAGFAETEVEIVNTNNSYSEGEDIKIPEKQPKLRDVSDEEEERFRRWEMAQEKPRGERRVSAPRSAVKEELQEELQEVKRINKKNYQPRRTSQPEDKKEEDFEATKEIRLKSDGVKNKAKEILGDIFPFKED